MRFLILISRVFSFMSPKFSFFPPTVSSVGDYRKPSTATPPFAFPSFTPEALEATKLVALALGVKRAARYLRNTGMPVAAQLAILAIVVQVVGVAPNMTAPTAVPTSTARPEGSAGVLPERVREQFRGLQDLLETFDGVAKRA